MSCKILRGPGFSHFFALPWAMALVLLTWDSYFRKQMEDRTIKGSNTRQLLRTFPRNCHMHPIGQNLNIPGAAAGVAGRCNLYSGISLLARVLGSVAVEGGEHVYQGTISCLCMGGGTFSGSGL